MSRDGFVAMSSGGGANVHPLIHYLQNTPDATLDAYLNQGGNYNVAVIIRGRVIDLDSTEITDLYNNLVNYLESNGNTVQAGIRGSLRVSTDSEVNVLVPGNETHQLNQVINDLNNQIRAVTGISRP